ncbi:low temperature requirement protein A [Streptococcus sp. H49]|uniref:low temperature requirement protein A n=1 Tax=Streptococcus huangxiaojuni TaxID=3237239 RepID=UPI0034A0DFE2
MVSIKAKRVSNYELFFDLAFVIAMGQLNSNLYHIQHLTASSVISFIFTNIILLSIWINEVYFFNQYGDARRIDIYTIIPLMYFIGNLSLYFDFEVETITASQVTVFNALLFGIYAVIALQYALKGGLLGFDKEIKKSIANNLIYALSVLPFVFQLLPASPFSMSIVYLIPIILPFFNQPQSGKLRTNFPHLVERAQLLTILTFGEAVIAIVNHYPMMQVPLTGMLFFLGMSLAFMAYMSQTYLNLEHRQNASGGFLLYAHIIIIIGVNFFTVGMEFLADSHHRAHGLTFLISAIILYYLGIGLTNYYNKPLYRLRKETVLHSALAAVVCCSLMAVFRTQLALIALFLVILNYYMSHITMLARRKAREQYNIPHPDPRQSFLKEMRHHNKERK